MKKLFSLLLCSALVFSGCGAEPETTEGTTQADTTKTVYVHSSLTRTDSAGTYRTEYVYRENNTLSDVVIRDDTDTEIQHYRVNCDENGNPVDWIATEDEIQSSIRYQFDDQGHTLGTYAYTGGELITSTEYTFSGDLRVSTTVKAVAQGFEQRIEYTYDENNRLIRQDQYVDGQLSAYAICTCDEQGRLIKSQGYDLENQPSSTITCTYEGNTETRVTALQDGTVLQTQVLTYDEHDNLLTNSFLDTEGNVLTSEEHTWKAIEVPIDSTRASI